MLIFITSDGPQDKEREQKECVCVHGEYTHARAYMWVCKCARMYECYIVCRHVCVVCYMHVCIVCVCVCVCVYTHTGVCVCVGLCICMCVFVECWRVGVHAVSSNCTVSFGITALCLLPC